MAKSFDQLIRQTMTKSARARAKQQSDAILAEMLLSELREAVGPSQQELADRLGIKQPSLSKLENQTDMQVSTLQRIVAALGGELEITVKLPRGRVRMTQFSPAPASRRTPRRATAAKKARPSSRAA